MRTEKEILQLMLEHQELFESGICGWVRLLYHCDLISECEADLMTVFTYANRPQNERIIGFYFWSYGLIQPRIEWINEQIKRLEDDEQTTN